MASILIVEDEVNIARFVELELKHEGYDVGKAEGGRQGLEMALSGEYDLVLLDIMLPEINGMEVLRRLRKESQVPVIMLTARDAVMDKVTGLDSGADDYITKPFAIEELLARIRLALKKSLRASDGTAQAETAPTMGLNKSDIKKDSNLLTNGKVVLNKAAHTVHVDGHEVELTNREFVLLSVLMENENIVLSRDTLLDKVCGYEYAGETNIIDVYVRYLRSKIDDAYNIKLITTVRGVGYVIKKD